MSRFKRFVTVGLAIFVVLFSVQLLKGHGLPTAARFAVIWAAASAAVFIATGMFYARQGIHCPVCNDPEKPPSVGGAESTR